MNAVELRRQKTQIVEEAGALAKTENITDEQRAQIDGLLSKAEQLEADAVRAEKLENYRGVVKPAPEAPAYHQRRTGDDAQSIFLRYIRTGDEGAQREINPAVQAEYRASNDTTINITTAADGGDLVPTGHFQGIIERARPLALYNQLGVRMIPGSGTTVNVPTDNEADDGQFVSTSESGEFDRDAPAVNKVAMTLVKYTKRLDLTYEIMQDEDSRLMDFLNNFVGAGMAATMNNLLITEALADGTAGLTLDSATAIGSAEIPELLYKLSAEYAAGNSVAWMMRRATEGYLRGLASQSQFVFGNAVGPATGNGTAVTSSLWGIPLHTSSFMGGLQASGKSLLIGNFNYMGMRLDPTMTFLRDPYSRASYGEVRLHYYFRTDFEVLQAAAFQYATHPTA